MACGCNKNRNVNRSPAMMPRAGVIKPASTSGPGVVRAQSINTGGISAERRKTQAIRRDAIKKALGK